MGTLERWRRAFGAIKDSTTVGLAKFTSDFKNLDIAIVKATNHEESPPKDLHVRRIIVATSFGVPRADVGYCIHTLSRRLTKTKSWIVAVKTLMVFHRILLEGDPSFREDLLTYSPRQPLFHVSEFRDESSQLARDCYSWIRTYASFLEERLECYRILGFDIETERLITAPGVDKAYSRTRVMNINQLLDQLPVMQQLLQRLIGCQPEGAACHNGLIQHALALILKESFKIYNVISDGISQLVESFFDLPKCKAVYALKIYKTVEKQLENLGEFYNLWKHLHPAMNIQFPTLSQLPPSFLATMDEYIKGPYLINGSVSTKNAEHEDVIEEQPPREIKEVEHNLLEVGNKEVIQDQEHKSKPLQKAEGEEEVVLPLITIDDDDSRVSAKSAELNDSIAPGSPLTGWDKDEKTSSWELSAVTLPSTNTTNISLEKSGGGLDMMSLYSLYEDDITKKQRQNDRFMMQRQTEKQPFHQYQNQYQQWYQHQQNRLMAYNHQQSSNQYLRRQMSNPKPNLFGDGSKYPLGNHGLM